jgi:hypothetical protein
VSTPWKLDSGFASEEEITHVHEVIVKEIASKLDGVKANAIFCALIRIAGELEPAMKESS